MADVLIRDVDDSLLARLTREADRRGLSLEAYLRLGLQQMVPPPRKDVLAQIDSIRARSRPWKLGEPTAVDYVHEGRSERERRSGPGSSS